MISREEIARVLPHDTVFQDTFRTYSGPEDVRYATGKATIRPSREIRVGSTEDFVMKFVVGEGGIEAGGSVKFALPRTWSQPQMDDPDDPGYVEGYCGAGPMEVRLSQWEPIEWYVTAQVHSRLEQGDAIRIEYRNVMVQKFPQTEWDNWRNHLEVFVSKTAGGPYRPMERESRYEVEILAGPPAKLRAILASRSTVGEEVSVRLSFLDEFDNPPHEIFEGDVKLALEPSGGEIPGTVEFTTEDGNCKEVGGLKLGKEGVFFVTAETGDGTISTRSNPTDCKAEGWKEFIYFGDTHSHTGISDSLGSPDEFFAHAKRVAGSDLVAIVDHNHYETSSVDKPWQKWMTPEQWQEIEDSVKKWDEPGRFVTILGVEEAKTTMGHRNILYPNDEQPLNNEAGTKEFWNFLKGKRALIVAHHSLNGVNWDDYHPEFEKVVEIYSMWGSSEYAGNPVWDKPVTGMSVQEILGTGAKVGFTGGSDCHHGQPDVNSHPSRFTNIYYKGGVTAVMVPELTREAVFSAMEKRRCYATTGERIALEFTVNGHQMGEEIGAKKGEKRVVKVRALGTGAIAVIDVVKNNANAFTHRGSGEVEEFEWVDEKRERETDYYYARVTQEDGAMAWSSPIWVSVK